jgi:hypothetical protein
MLCRRGPGEVSERLQPRPSDAEIERGLRERAVTSARDAEVLLRRRQTVRPPETTRGVDLDALSEGQRLESRHRGGGTPAQLGLLPVTDPASSAGDAMRSDVFAWPG